ncbi:MAG: hypothetical protein ACOYZ7_07085 [Chloroflexota bacterium]
MNKDWSALKRIVAGLAVLCAVSACTVITPTPTQVVAPTDTPKPAATVTPAPTATATPAPPAVDALEAAIEAGLMPTPTPDASGWAPSSISQVVVLPLQSPAGQTPLWAVASNGGRYFEADQYHFVAIYAHQNGDWQELARHEFVPNFEAEPMDPGADYFFDNSLAQVFIGPDRIWLQVDGGAGAHGGTYHLLSFDGQTLKVELANFTPSPGMVSAADLDGDGVQEVLFDASDPYVFCYACGVRKIAYQVFAWDSANEHMAEVTLQPLLMGQPQPLRDAVNPAVELAQAGLWQDAAAQIEPLQDLLAEYPDVDTQTATWDRLLIELHAEAMAAEVADSAYPLLANLFYGDYTAALDLMRPYSPAQLFSPDSPLIVGTVADGWLEALNDWIARSTTQALALEPDLAAAYFLRGWAAYLLDPYDAQALADVEKAVELAPGDPLFSQIEIKDLQDKSLTEAELEWLATGYAVEVRKFEKADVTYRASFYTHRDWFANPNYLIIARIEAGQTTVVYQMQETRRFLLDSYGPQGPRTLGWLDMNADGLMELPYIVDQGGNCWGCSQMQVLQLQADDSVVSLTDAVPEQDRLGESLVLGTVMDMDGDGVEEWLVYDVSFEFAFGLCHACSPIAHRVYAWDGTVYREASTQFPDYYQGQIDNLTAEVEAMRQSQEPWSGYELGPMVSLLLTYQNAGRGEEGLALFEEYSEPAQYGDRLTEEQLQSLNEAREYFLTQ